MLLRCSSLLVILAAFVGQTGCCGTPWGGCWPNGKNWCGSQCCGCVWHEWFSFPPPCCDPCDDCGCFTGHRLNDDLYSHGNDYANYGGTQPQPTRAEPIQRPAPARGTQPYTPRKAQPYSPRDSEPYTLPGPSDDMPIDPSTDRRRGYRGQRMSYSGQRMSYNAPLPAQEAMPARTPVPAKNRRLQATRLTDYGRAAYDDMVDSQQPSRTLEKPPRTRLFSR